jgi:aminoglycoside N3'-acetyltransferase
MNANPPPGGIAGMLEQLGVPRQRLLYVQTSADWIQRAGFDASTVLPALMEWVGSAGTLVMPSYPFATTHLEYLERGAVYDVRRTPSAIGLLPEIFRRSKGVTRSLDPDFCVAAAGADADAIVGTAPAEPDPFGPDSSYQRMLDRHATLVGLGVSANTNSFIHVIDSLAGGGYPSPVYEDRPLVATVVDADGASRTVTRKALRPRYQQLTRPSAVETEMVPPPAAFAVVQVNEARFFRWDLDQWSSWCLAHAHAQSARGGWPCWLSRLAATVE